MGGGMKKNQKNFDKCCLEHDACLQTCGMSSEACHDVYQKCSEKVCKSDKNCNFQSHMAQMMNSPYTMDYTTAKSEDGEDDKNKRDCYAYDRLQQESCECVPEGEFDATFEKRLKTFYKLYNKEKLDSNGEIKDLEQVKTKWGGKEPEMFLELTKKYKTKAIDKRTKPKPPPYTPPPSDSPLPEEYDVRDGTQSQPDTEAEPPAEEPEDSSGFQAQLKILEDKKAKAVEDEDFDKAGILVDEIKEIKKSEVERLRKEKTQAIADEDYLKAKTLKKRIAALDPKDEL